MLQKKRRGMCQDEDECVETVTEIMEELFREKTEMKERLHAMQERIGEEENVVAKWRRWVERVKEKERSIQLLKTVQPSPNSFLSLFQPGTPTSLHQSLPNLRRCMS